VFILVPVTELSVADMTVFSALLLFAHFLPVEQRIIQKAGAGFVVTTILRLAGGMIYALMLSQLFRLTGILSSPINPTWIPVAEAIGWPGFIASTAETMAWMLVILLALAWLIEFLKWSGLLELMKRGVTPLFRYAGIGNEASELVAIGLLLGISYGGGLLIREVRSGRVHPRQVFLSCVFMGFAHSIIEDTLIVVALGADLTSVLLGRLVFAIAATALIAAVVRKLPDREFFKFAFDRKSIGEAGS